MKREIVVALAVVAVSGARAWIARLHPVEAASGTTVELRQVEVGYAVGSPVLKARLTLATGEAIEHSMDDPAEAQAFLRLAEMFLAGRTRMFAEVDGRRVLGVHVSGPL